MTGKLGNPVTSPTCQTPPYYNISRVTYSRFDWVLFFWFLFCFVFCFFLLLLQFISRFSCVVHFSSVAEFVAAKFPCGQID